MLNFMVWIKIKNVKNSLTFFFGRAIVFTIRSTRFDR